MQQRAASPAESSVGSPGHSIHNGKDGYENENNHESVSRTLSPQGMIKHLQSELEDSHIRIARDTGVINNLHEKVTELEELVQKQKITISNQSRAISDRRSLRKQSPMAAVFPMTPHYHHPVQHLLSCHQPLGHATGHSPSPSMVPSPFHSPQSNRSFNSNIFEQPPPKFELPLGGSFPAYTPILRDPLGLANVNRDVFIPLSAAPAHDSTDFRGAMADFSTRFQELMRKSEVFGQTHANFPNIFRDSHLEDRVKEYLMAISNRAQASVLLGNVTTRCCLITKAVNFYLVEEVLRITVVRGFDTSTDLEIGQIQRQMTPADNLDGQLDTPLTVRHLMIMAMTTHLGSLTKKPGFADFCHQKTQSHVAKLWQYIRPLSHNPAKQNSQAVIDLTAIMSEAQSLALDMHMVPLEYKFDFPEPGEHFDPLTMINRDSFIVGDPQTLKSNETRVGLGITPVVRIRNNSESPGDIKLIYLGNVLLKLPRKHTA
ncbi:hypothetical protein AOCH_002835 [Aspergillus ochraceoroseus]|uniref:Uncharacterized protein n=1 Tax=Aspergillus ochraceoroseus TaxID=138278 RepID=A0A0F8WRP6_9EURO|nr:hypothetical protein AOCH_002835 [Aspergillus ochraceoroseus]